MEEIGKASAGPIDEELRTGVPGACADRRKEAIVSPYCGLVHSRRVSSPRRPASDIPCAQQLAASGGTEPYRWQVFDGALPSGLQLNRKRDTISGTPTAAGQHLFQVQVSDRSIARYARKRQSVVAEFTVEVLRRSRSPPGGL